MSRELKIAYFAHSIRSDWNNGNAHFLRGLMRALGQIGQTVTVYEPKDEWSITHLLDESRGEQSLAAFTETYPDLNIQTYTVDDSDEIWCERLRAVDIVLLHEWNPPALAELLLHLRAQMGYKLLFHDTHHRASSSPEQIALFGLQSFDGIVAFGNALRDIYRERFGITQAWTLHEAADTSVFSPRPEIERRAALVWIGNWGEGERSAEIREFLLKPARQLSDVAQTTIYGVRYPEDGLRALEEAGVAYGGYLANLSAPEVYAGASVTVHVPRQQYSHAMTGIPTIRVFEALACGIPLVSAPWRDTEQLFHPGDFAWAQSCSDMEAALRLLLTDRARAEDQAARGRETVLAQHTCVHRARELTSICEEILQ